MNEQLIIIRTLEELQSLTEYVKTQEYIAYDTESTGVDIDSQVIGFSICSADDIEVGFYVILYAWDTEQKKLIELETTKGAVECIQALLGKKLIMQNAPHDCRITKSNFGVELIQDLVHDTMIGGHILNENRANGLKERGVELYGEDARTEQNEMKASVEANGGVLTKNCYELYKADADLIAKYGAKDAILTMKVFLNDVPLLYKDKLDKFFYDDESMPLLKGPTYELNTTGLRVDPVKLQNLRGTLETEIEEARAFIDKEIANHIKEKYNGKSKKGTFNIGSGQQLAWLLFGKLEEEFNTLTDAGKAVAKALDLDVPYSPGAKREFIRVVWENQGKVFRKAGYFNPKTKKKLKRDQTIGEPWKYIAAGKPSLKKFADKYKWVAKLLEFAKNKKLLSTYVIGIQTRMRYNIIRPGFLQHGTTSGRYSSRNPNFQNLPRDDKRIKACIISRPGKVFVGADYSQLEPRVFASFSGDERLLACFKSDADFYSVIGMEVFGKTDCTPHKEGSPEAFGVKYKKLRDIAKVVALSATYGTTAFKMAPTIGKSTDEAQMVINDYFETFPSVRKLMLRAHEDAKKEGCVYNLFGRPRRMPAAMDIPKIYGKTEHADLPYVARNLLNLAINHRIQSTGASIMNRAAIAVWRRCRELEAVDAAWAEVKIVLQVHDELVLEAPEHLAEQAVQVLKYGMEQTVTLPGVDLIAEPKIAYNLADLK